MGFFGMLFDNGEIVGKCFLCDAPLRKYEAEQLADSNYICKTCVAEKGIDLINKDSAGKHLNTTEDVLEQIKKNGLAMPDQFKPTKRVPDNDRTSCSYLEIDEPRRLFNLPYVVGRFLAKNEAHERIHPFENLVDFQLIDDGTEIIDGNSIVGAALGALTFGGAGGIIGSGLRDKKVTKECNKLEIKVVLNDISTPVEYINLIDFPVERSEPLFDSMYTNAQECLSLLAIILKQNQEQAKKQIPASAADNTDAIVEQIRKYKSLLDDGIITQDEFNAKKKQLLGL